MFLEVTAHALW